MQDQITLTYLRGIASQYRQILIDDNAIVPRLTNATDKEKTIVLSYLSNLFKGDYAPELDNYGNISLIIPRYLRTDNEKILQDYFEGSASE